MSIAYGLNPEDLSQSGWGLLLPAEMDQSTREAILKGLQPLLELRRSQTGSVFRLFTQETGVYSGDTARRFLERFGISGGPVDPNRMPYYLLIAAPPSQIPFSFQTSLSVDYAVGRIWFERPEDWHNYALSVVQAENEALSFEPEITLFCPTHPDDIFTQNSSGWMQTLAQGLETRGPLDWQINLIDGERAHKSALIGVLAERAPEVLFTAGHSLVFPPGHADMVSAQGGLVCADWLGPRARGSAIPREMSFQAGDLTDQVDLSGRLVVQYASFSLGTPVNDNLSQGGDPGHVLANQPFLARLPQRLLSLPEGRGALAVIGWIDRLWVLENPVAPAIFESSLRRFQEWGPVGWAFEYINERYIELAAELSYLQDDLEFGGQADESPLADVWAGMQNSRGMAIFGDPAARLPVRGPLFEDEIVGEKVEWFAGEREHISITDAMSEEALVLEMRLARREIAEYSIQLLGEAVEAEAIFSFDFNTLQAAEIEPQKYGELLFERTLRLNPIYDIYRQVERTAAAAERELSLRLVIDKSALELNELRWECLFDPTLSAYITLGDRFSFQRYLSSTDWRSISIRKIDRFSTLLAVASPDNLKDYNLAPLDRSSEAQNLKWVLPGMPLTILPASDGTPVTLNSLYRELREGYDFLYLACHSMLRDGEVYLFFEDELGQADIVSSKELAKSLSQLKRLPRLVVIGGVQTAPLARLLAEAGVPAVLAALHYVSIETMREFSQAFFEELLQSGRVDRAAAEARTKVLMSSRPDWWSPVLYTRVREGKIWR